MEPTGNFWTKLGLLALIVFITMALILLAFIVSAIVSSLLLPSSVYSVVVILAVGAILFWKSWNAVLYWMIAVLRERAKND